MLVAGGLLDQPATEWFNANYAGYVWSLLERIASPDFKPGTLRADERDAFDMILDIRNSLSV